jgi:hypothetical protein
MTTALLVASRALDRAGYGVLWLALALLPLQGFGATPLRPLAGLILFDSLVALALPLSLVRLLREHARLLGAPALWLPLSLACAGVVSELTQPEPGLTARLSEQAAPLVTAALIAAHAGDAGRRRGLVTAALVGGTVALLLALGGYVIDLGRGTHVFSSSGAHPIFDGLPRLIGTFGGAAQRAGSFAVYLLALSLGASDGLPWLGRRLASALSLLALALSMSFAWLGGALLLALRVPGRLRLVAVPLVLLATLIGSVPLLRGPPSARLAGDCDALDAEHYLVVPIARSQCLRLSEGGRAITRYAEAKRAAVEAVLTAPLFGVGYSGFADFSEQVFREKYAQSGEHYEQPHGLIPGLAAKHGVLGALLLPLWLVLLSRGWQSSVFDHAVVAFLLMGLFVDVDRLREIWVLWGFLATQGLATRGRGAGDAGAHWTSSGRSATGGAMCVRFSSASSCFSAAISRD